MNKFEKLVGNNGDNVLARRASNSAELTKLAQEALINVIKTDIATKNHALIKLTDLAPTNKDSLTPNTPEGGENMWVEQVQQIKLDLYKLNISLEVANSTYTEFFGELPEDGDDSDDSVETPEPSKKAKTTAKK